MRQPCFGTDSKVTAIQKQTFGLSQVVHKRCVLFSLHAQRTHAQHWTQGLGAHGKALKQPCFTTNSTGRAMLNAKMFQYSQVVHKVEGEKGSSWSARSAQSSAHMQKLGHKAWQSDKALKMQGSSTELIITTVKAQICGLKHGLRATQTRTHTRSAKRLASSMSLFWGTTVGYSWQNQTRP